MKYEEMKYDLVIVGAGPAGLSTAIKVKQLDKINNTNHSVCILEKGAEVGSHIISGAILETSSLDELLPNWRETDIPVKTKVSKENFYYLTKNNYFRLPDFLLPKQMKNEGNFIVSLGNLCKWLANYAESLGVDIFPGFSAQKLYLNEDDGAIQGVITGEKGLGKNGEKLSLYESSVALLGKQTVFAEGCRGHLGKQLIKKFNLYDKNNFQTYAIGLKELWEIDNSKFEKGSVLHSIGWPLNNNAYGGSFFYKLSDNLASIGFVVGLDYQNPYLNPYEEFQKFKTNKIIKNILSGGKRVSYGARALNEGGYQSLPKLTFPGGAIIGCNAGTLNVLKIKGSHTAMKSGMIFAEEFHKHYQSGSKEKEIKAYMDSFKKSSIQKELFESRNVRPGFKNGMLMGLLNTFLDQKILRGKAPWTLKHTKKDNEKIKNKNLYDKIIYPKADNKITFDKLSNLSFSGTNHKENQPCHLLIQDVQLPLDVNLNLFASPETRYCPANVYEILEENIEEDSIKKRKKYKLQINFQNCLHCKTCDIKDPLQNIQWTTPEGGDGPRYSGM